MRGAPHPIRRALRTSGIIPADAGSTFRIVTLARAVGDHPRGCGEHDPGENMAWDASGSSPRMRGALFSRSVATGLSRIIPADAGSTVLV